MVVVILTSAKKLFGKSVEDEREIISLARGGHAFGK